MAQFQRLSTNTKDYIPFPGRTIKDVKGTIAAKIGVLIYYVDIVNLEEGIIYDNDREISSLPKPLQVMVGNPNRTVPHYLVTREADIITLDEDDDQPRLKMSCGHAICPDNLFGHMKDSLMTKVSDRVCCPECSAEWSMQEIIRKADMTEDERIFFEFRISFNLMNHENAPTSTCPDCGRFCQRQDDVLPIRCTFCSKGPGKEFNFCWECKARWYPNHQCGDDDLEVMQSLLNNAPKKTIDYSHIEQVPSKRMCPKCRSIIEHEKMCKQMTCKRCKTDFCFSCLTVCVDRRLQCSGYDRKCTVAPVQNVYE